MAGHSKWKQIKHKKAATDAKRGAAFTKLIKEITVAARQGGGDPAGNARLRSAIDAARGANMPSDNIERAIKKGTGELEGVSYEDVVYEGYGPGGAAILLQVTTDNVNRTVAEIRHIFGRYGGNLGAPNSVAWMFDKKGLIFVEAVRYDEDTVLEAALEAGAEDAAREGDDYVVAVEPARVHGVADGLRSRGIQPRESEIAMKPRQSVKVAGADAERLLKLMDALEEHEDVAKAFSNFDIDADTLAAVSG